MYPRLLIWRKRKNFEGILTQRKSLAGRGTEVSKRKSEYVTAETLTRDSITFRLSVCPAVAVFHRIT